MDLQLETQMGAILRARGLRIAFAESCTGGLLSDRVTNVPGSSEYFLGSLVAYAYEAKANLLGVSWETLNTHGAVSRDTVLEMARGARRAFQADLSASISGIAGPGGGTPAKPVGTVWVAFVSSGGEWAQLFHFDGSREEIKAASVDAALRLVLDYLEGSL